MSFQVALTRFYIVPYKIEIEGRQNLLANDIRVSNSNARETFRNRKGFLSLNIEVICRPDCEAYVIVARWPGSLHDYSIFKDSMSYRQILT